MKKTLSALVAVAIMSLGVAFADEAKTQTTTAAKTTTNAVTGATTEKKTTKKTHKKVTKKSGAVKSDTTKTEATTASTPAPATK